MTPVWEDKGVRNVATLTEATLLEDGVLVAEEPLPGSTVQPAPRLLAGAVVAVGSFEGEARIVRILGSRRGVAYDAALGEFEWEVRKA